MKAMTQLGRGLGLLACLTLASGCEAAGELPGAEGDAITAEGVEVGSGTTGGGGTEGGAAEPGEGPGGVEIPSVPLAIISVKPNSGPATGGTIVAVQGQGIRADVEVLFGAAPALNVAVQAGIFATCVSPPGEEGVVDVTLRHPDGTEATLPGAFEYRGALGVDEVVPDEGPVGGGNLVLVKGSGFAAGAKVFFDAAPASSVSVEAPGLLSALVPPGSAGAVDVTVEAADGTQASRKNAYEYVTEESLDVFTVVPAQGPASGGNVVVLEGSGFEPGAQVRFGETQATGAVVHGPGVLTATVPAAGPGPVNITVELPSGEVASLADGYTYVEDVPLAVFAVTPPAGPTAGGQLAIVQGQGFAAGDVVRFGAAKAFGVSVESPSLITVTVPPGEAGASDVSVKGLDGDEAILAGGYLYEEVEILAVAALQPASGPAAGGTLAMISGTGFAAGASITVGGVPGAGTSVASSQVIVFTTPELEPGEHDLVVTNPDGEDATLTAAWSAVEAVAPGGDLALSAISPASGPTAGGTPIVVAGAGFTPGLEVFVGGTAAVAVEAISGELLTALTPPGEAGAADVTLVGEGGEEATLVQGFAYITDGGEPPSVAAVTPKSGPTPGGTLITVEGEGFQPGALVWVGALPAADHEVVSPTLAVATTPPGAVGAVAISVVNPNGATGSLDNAFGYFQPGTVPAQPPLVTGVLPALGFSGGGQLVTISGAGFTAGATVHFGPLPAEVVGLQGSSLLEVLTPAHPAGAVDVTVTSPQGLSSKLPSGFVYFDTPPFVGWLDPASGPTAGGNPVVLHGKAFEPGASVEVGGVIVPNATVAASDLITLHMPAHGAGPVDVVVTNPDGLTDSLVGGYLYLVPEPPEPPILEAVSPADGPAAGGLMAVLTGEGFAEGATVRFDDSEATLVQVHAPTVITAIVPAGEPAAVVGVTVTNPSGLQGALEQGFTYQPPEGLAPLGLVAVVPGSGPEAGGNVVTLTGSGFVAGTTVRFGEVDADSVAFVSPSVLTAVAPPQAAGLVDVAVTRPDQQQVVAFNAYLYKAELPDVIAPIVFSATPSVGPTAGGTTVEVHGAHFQLGAGVLFGADPALSVIFASPELLVAKAPSASPSTASLTVTNPDGGAAVLPSAFTWYEPLDPEPPLVFSTSPFAGSALGGDEVVVAGKGFEPGVAIFICGQKAQVLSVAPVEVSALTPSGPLGACDVEAVNADGLSALLPAGFKYVPAEPEVSDIIPKKGPVQGGTSIVVQGKGFMAGAQVLVGGLPAAATVWSSNTINAITPAQSEGPADVQILNPGGTTALVEDGFLYEEESEAAVPPIITSVFPAAGPVEGGTPVEVHGGGFQEGLTVLLGGGLVSSVVVPSEELITFLTPPGAPGSVALTILNPTGLGATLPGAFEYLAEVDDPPALLGISPGEGPQSGGTPVTISGANLAPGGQLFVGGQPLLNVTFVSDAVVTGVTPLGLPGPADLLYVGADGQFAKLDGAFQYVPGPLLDGVEPELGPLEGGTQLTLFGKHFKPDMAVFFGGQQGQVINVQSDLLAIVATPPTEVAGPVDVTVVNPDGQPATLEAGFHFLAPPTLLGAAPSQGPETGGTPVTLKGTGFFPGAAIEFGTLAATSVAVLDSTTIVAVAPAHIPGPVDVILTNPDGQKAIAEQAFTFSSLVNLAPPPEVSLMIPTEGPVGGGVLVSLVGSGFQEGVEVTFDSQPGIDLVRISGELLLVSAPAHQAGTAAVIVINPDGQSTEVYEKFTWLEEDLGPPPQLTGLDVASGPTEGGNVVGITGSNLAEGIQVFFGLTPSPNVTVVSATEAQAVAPPHPQAVVDVTVVAPDGQSDTLDAIYAFAPPPLVLGVSPNTSVSEGGRLVSVIGGDFEPGLSVLFCEDYETSEGCVAADPLTVDVLDDGSELDLVTPPHAPATVDVAVVNPDGQVDVLSQGFVYSPLPSIDAVSPETISTLGGDELTLEGSGFQQGAMVWVGGQGCEDVIFESKSLLTCLAPAGEAGLADVAISNPDQGEGLAEAAITYVPPPTIAQITPSQGAELGGTQVTITGTGFVQGPPATTVQLGTEVLPIEDVQVLGTTTIVFLTPPGAGALTLTLTNPDGQQIAVEGAFVYVPPTPPPVLNYVVPQKGLTTGGYAVQVVGTAMLEGAKVFFGAPGAWAQATDVEVKNAGTLISLLAPAAEDEGPVAVRVVNTDGQEAVLDDAFTYKAPLVDQPLQFLTMAPSKSLVQGGGTSTVTGQGFAPGVQVFFGEDPDWTPATSTERLGPTLLKVTVPPAPNGLPGVVDVRVANPASTSGQDAVVIVDGFEYSAGAVFGVSDGARLPPEPHNDKFPLLVDANGDGRQDVFVFRNGDDRLLTNVPSEVHDEYGFFQQSFPWPTPGNMSNPGHAASGDLDEDGDVDLVVRGHQTRIYRCMNSGAGEFECFEFQGYESACNNALRELTLSDIDCDGHLDLLVANYSQKVSCPNWIFVGDGEGNLDRRHNVVPPHFEHTNKLAVADVDLDGDVDVVVANDDAMQNRLYYNNCNDTTLPPDCYFDVPDCTPLDFDGHHYSICNDNRTWQDARKRCEEFGMKLATIDSYEEQITIEPLLSSYGWIGLNDHAEDGAWEWIGEPGTDYEGWCSGEPDLTDDCVVMRDNSEGCWDDRYCNEGWRYVCEAPVDEECPVPWSLTDGTYGAGKNFPISGGNTRDISLVDLDDNGFVDAIVGQNGQQTQVFMNYSGNFELDDGQHFPQDEEDDSVVQLEAVDFDLDGDEDLLVVGGDYSLRLYNNDYQDGGIGAFTDVTEERLSAEPIHGDPAGVAVGDLDGDGAPDVYVVNAFYSDHILLNGGYEPGSAWADDDRVPVGHLVPNTFERVPERHYPGARAALFGDLDGDDDLDMVKCGWGQPLRIHMQEEGRFLDESEARIPQTLFECPEDGLELVDLDDDGDLDLLLGEHYDNDCGTNGICSGNLHIFDNDGEGVFTDITDDGVPKGSWKTTSLAATDIDQDGDIDIFLASYNTTSWQKQWTNALFMNVGDPFNTGGFHFFEVMDSFFADFKVNGQYYDGPINYIRRALFVDIDGQDPLDLYLARNGQNQILLGTEESSFDHATEEWLPTVSDNSYDSVLADFDLDGDVDIYSANDGQDRFYIRESIGKYADITTSALPGTDNLKAKSRAAVAGDLDGDLLPEVVVANYEGTTTLLGNLGESTFTDLSENLPRDYDRSWRIELLDLDGDDDLDLYLVNEGQDRILFNLSMSP